MAGSFELRVRKGPAGSKLQAPSSKLFRLVELKVVLEHESTKVIKSMVMAGLGLAILPEPNVRKEARRGELAVLPLTDLKVSRTIYAIADARRQPWPEALSLEYEKGLRAPSSKLQAQSYFAFHTPSATGCGSYGFPPNSASRNPVTAALTSARCRGSAFSPIPPPAKVMCVAPCSTSRNFSPAGSPSHAAMRHSRPLPRPESGWSSSVPLISSTGLVMSFHAPAGVKPPTPCGDMATKACGRASLSCPASGRSGSRPARARAV
ncbi:MAG TPA: hypothetical protein DCS97_06410 [Planctomycetes bacterium]|nr:hypothetical protein [Planctomycetota bacterium]